MIWMAAVEAAETKQMKMACQRQEALAKSLDLKLVSTSDEEPTVADRQKAQAAADGRGCPKLPAPLCWGYKGTKKKEIYVFATEGALFMTPWLRVPHGPHGLARAVCDKRKIICREQRRHIDSVCFRRCPMMVTP